MKIATCTHCGRDIYYDEPRKEWLHVNAEPGRNKLTCTKIEFATPKRGSIETKEESAQ